MTSGHEFSVDDKVYYLYTNASGTCVKFAAIVIGHEPDGVAVRVGRYDPERMEVATFESVVPAALLQTRTISCSYEDELTGRNPG